MKRVNINHLTLSQRRPLSYRNQSIDLKSKSMDWFLHDKCPRHERVNANKYWWTQKNVFFQNLTVFNEIWRTAKENFPTSARDT